MCTHNLLHCLYAHFVRLLLLPHALFTAQSKYSGDKWAKGTIYRASYAHYTIKFDHEGRTFEGFEGCYLLHDTTLHNNA